MIKLNIFRENFRKRSEESDQLAGRVIDCINKVQSQALTVTDWRRVLENIVYNYNSALAKGMLTTSPMATGGKGERGGKNAIRSFASQHFVTKEESDMAAAVVLEQAQKELLSVPSSDLLNISMLPAWAERLVDLPDVGKILDISSAKALVMINGGVADIPGYLMRKTAYMVTHMKSRYREKETETRQWLLDHPEIWLPDDDMAFYKFVKNCGLSGKLNIISTQINMLQPGGNNIKFIRTKFLKDYVVMRFLTQSDALKKVINEFSSKKLRELRKKILEYKINSQLLSHT